MLEDEAGQPVDPEGILNTFAQVIQARDLSFSLTIRPIDLTGKTVPADLEGVRFNDPQMATRLNAVVDHVVGILPVDRLTSIQIGNEIDGFDASGEHPEFWSDYGSLLAAVRAHAQANHPGLRIGFTGTFHGLTSGQLRDLGVWTAYAGVVDVVGVTYYPLDGGFQVLGADQVAGHLQMMVDEFPDSPILLQEVGYPSSAENSSDEATQAEFFCSFFEAWDAHAGRIELANVVRLYDVTEAGALRLAGPYGLESPAFLEYLRTLGLRGADEGGKSAYEAVVEAAEARGF